ncbi:MAG TPA: sigma-70 family RNA polymerase sigma factor [Bacillota bacterium]|jgi:RNA polymerase sigma-70 factor (ECF subfamily)|nr:sigma-70 family RNA polymerase sigma factor [Bacillota bacterium]
MNDLRERVRAGDRNALEQLFAENIETVSKMASSIAGARCDIEDMVQEALLRAVRSIRNFRWECSFSTWLYRILVNVNKDFARKACSAEIVSLDQLAEQNDDALPCVRSEIGQPEEEAIRQEECETLAEAIRALPRLDSSVLWMREALNLSYAEIADNLGCSVESVRSRLWRARRRLRENMALLIPEHVPQ